MNDYVTDNKIETFYALEDFISKKNVQGVSEIVRAGFDINCVPPSHHLSPLSFACMLRNAEIARLLLDYGADANISGRLLLLHLLQYQLFYKFDNCTNY